MSRLDKDQYFLKIAQVVALRSTCIRRQYGAVIVSTRGTIISTGYNGAPVGEPNCCDVGYCWREENNIPHGQRYEKCLSGDTTIKLLNGKYMTIAEMAKSSEREFWVYSVDTETGEIVPAKAFDPHKTKVADKMVKITFDNGGYIRCTEDHLILMRNGQYLQAKDLSFGDSVMPMNYFFQNADHEYISNTPTMRKDSRWALADAAGKTKVTPTHLVVYKNIHGDVGKGNVVHHADFDSHNNTPDNLVRMSFGNHSKLHVKERGVPFTKESYEKAANTMRRKLQTDENYRKQVSERGKRNMSANWNNPEWVKRHNARAVVLGAKLAASNNSDPDLILRKRRTIVAKGMSTLMFYVKQNGGNPEEITEANYEQTRRNNMPHNGKGKDLTPKINTILRYFDTFDQAVEAGKNYNHKVVSIEIEECNEDVYDMSVPDFQNFAVCIGEGTCVFVHNCNAVHAESNAILSAPPSDMEGATLYLAGWENGKTIDNPQPCEMCRRYIANARIARVVTGKEI